MQRLGEIVHQLARYHRRWERLLSGADMLNESRTAQPQSETPPEHGSRLTEQASFGSNPGNLRMFTYAPPRPASSPPLVVVLHGCTQTAAGYDLGTGWSTLADRYGFVLLFPEQRKANNPKRCFNWFRPDDIRRGQGEALSIRQMIEHAIQLYGIDRSRVYVTGLSAGGAMTSTMLAAYPEVFAGGAIIAGLPYLCATSIPEAFECMFHGKTRSAHEWGDLVRNASSHGGPWPRVSVWHGSEDETVTPLNASEIIKQWTDVHGLPLSPAHEEKVDGYPRRVWSDAAGQDVIEEYTITGMAHGTPLAIDGENGSGASGPFLLDAGISSSYHIAKFWGLTTRAQETAPATPASKPVAAAADRMLPEPGSPPRASPDAGKPTRPLTGEEQRDEPASHEEKPALADIGSVIARALKAAGLMK